MLDTDFLKTKFAAALPYGEYVATGKPDQQSAWGDIYAGAELHADQRKLVEGFTREMNILISSGVWCGDCVQQCPLIQRIAMYPHLGPMDFDAYMEMLPDTSNLSQLRELVDVFNSDCLDYEVTLVLRGEEVRRAQLSSNHTRLGWSSWLGEESPQDQSVTFKFRGWKHGRG